MRITIEFFIKLGKGETFSDYDMLFIR